MTVRKTLVSRLTAEPRSIASMARELGLSRDRVEDELEHAIRSARTEGYRVVVVPARCRICGFVFAETRLTRPSRCPQCRRGSIFEPQIYLRPSE